MLTIQVRLLSGRYVATQFDDRDSPEWPPHPARLFAAAVSAWADMETPDPVERAALTWWESLGAPAIVCSPWDDTGMRTVVTHYVPVNDVRGVLSRDPKDLYWSLGDALDDRVVAAAAPDPKQAARAVKKADSAILKAQRTAARYASGGTAPASALEVFPESRVRQARTYPSATPADETVLFVWPDAEDQASQVEVLDEVLSRVGRLGHSSTPVDVAVIPSTNALPVFEPGEPAEVDIRTTSPGQLDALIAAYQTHQGSELRTLPAATTGYREHVPSRRVASSAFEDRRWLVFDLDPRRGPRDALLLTRALRSALMKHADQPPAPMISGHQRSVDGAATAPSKDDHAAFLALPYVGSRYADGSIHALAVVLPRMASEEDRDAVITAARQWQKHSGRLVLGRSGDFRLTPLDPQDASVTARASTWSRAATRWSSVLPVALDRHPGSFDTPDLAKRERAFAEAEQSVLRACRNIGLPKPVSMAIRSDAPIRGTRPVGAFRSFTVGARQLRRMLVHVDLTFAELVRGPIILGSGRFFGYGLCWPHPEVA